jgi:hypothetical protein
VVAVDCGGQKTGDNSAPLRIARAAAGIIDVQVINPV